MAGIARPQTSRRKHPGRRSRHGTTSHRGKRRSWRLRLVLAVSGVFFFVLASGILARHLAPTPNTTLTRFDAIIVLGDRVDSDGNPAPEQQARVSEAVREYERGVAPRLIFTGGAAHNRYIEAQVMARTARAQGIPSTVIFTEPEAKDTIQNACFSARIMKEHGWSSAEVVSSAAHLPRAGLIFSRQPIQWSTHAAPPISPHSEIYNQAAATVETLKMVRYLTWARWTEDCKP